MKSTTYIAEATPEFQVDETTRVSPYRVGETVPVNAPTPRNQMSFGRAFLASTGVASYVRGIEAGFDQFYRAANPYDNLDVIEDGFNPFKLFKDNKHSPEEFDTIMHMTNSDQYSNYVAARQEQFDAEEKLLNSGFSGGAAYFAAQLIDPTLPFGFGAAKMLSSGFTNTRALVLSGVAGASAYEAGIQATDVGETRSLADSMITIGAAGVLSGVMGKAIDTLAARAAKKGTPVNFQQTARQVVDEIQQNQYKDLSAMVSPAQNEELTKMYGWAANKAAVLLKPFSAKIRGQLAKEGPVRSFYDSLVGRRALTVGDVQGAQRKVSMMEEHENIAARTLGMMTKFREDFDQFVRQTGKKPTKADFIEAIRRGADPNDLLDDGSVSAKIAQFDRDYYKWWDEELKANNIEGYETRANFGRPLLWDEDAVRLNYPVFEEMVVNVFKRSKPNLADDLVEVKTKVANLEARLKTAKSDDVRQSINERLVKLATERQTIEAMLDEGDDLFIGRARAYANAIASRNQNETVLGQFADSTLPSRFKERGFDIREFAEFVQKSPIKVAQAYARDVSPYLASQRVFGYRTPEIAVENLLNQLDEKIAELRRAGDKPKELFKLEKERERAKTDAQAFWDDMTGNTVRTAAKANKPFFLGTTAAKGFITATSLGGATLSSLAEPSAIALTHHYAGISGFSNTLTKIATSPEIRQMVRKDAHYLLFATDWVTHMKLHGDMVDEYASMGVAGKGWLDKTAKGMQIISNVSQVLNGMVGYTSQLRRILYTAQQGIIKNSLEMLVDGTITAERKTDLAFLGVSTKEQARRILRQAAKYGEEKEGQFFFNLEKWDDKNLQHQMEILFQRDNRRTSLQPDLGDTPHIFRMPGVNLLFLFKSWAVTAGQEYGLKSLQKSDAASLVALSGYVGFSSLAYMLAEVARGNEPPTDIDEILYAGVTNSGVLGVLPDYGGHYLMNKLFGLESGGAKYAERQDLQSTAGGPLLSKLGDVQGAVARPIGQAIDPEKDVEFDNTFWKNFLDVLPVPVIKQYIKNQLLTE